MRKIYLFLFLLAFAIASFYFRSNILDLYFKIFNQLPEVEMNIDSFIEDIKKEISIPPPLRLENEALFSFLTRAGVIRATNVERTKNNLFLLKENAKLNSAALAKAQDMLKNQYFEHDSPSGVSPSDLAKNAGYGYILIGENLAMGNFGNDAALVQAWMDSPGHRANILNGKYTEIGVAVLKGSFEGKETWLAVQEFGLPLSACPQPSVELKNQIEVKKTEANSLADIIENKRAEIEGKNFNNRQEYIQVIQEYNNLVKEYDALAGQIKTMINNYNQQVYQFNACAS